MASGKACCALGRGSGYLAVVEEPGKEESRWFKDLRFFPSLHGLVGWGWGGRKSELRRE